MNDAGAKDRDGERPVAGDSGIPSVASRARGAWTFVYIFFSNGTPFDAPNRSEPCPRR